MGKSSLLGQRLAAGLGAALLLAGSGAAADIRPKARLDTGVIVGTEEHGAKVFKGVPFARAPVGALRWAPPAALSPWASDRDASQFAPACPQPLNADGKPNGGGVSGPTREDCLYLNVWAPRAAKKAPVMLWLYGGAAYLGAGHLGSYNGEAFARNGVVVVTINYRLGTLGYFSHPALTKAARPGEPLSSYALMDAVEALKWVKRNAAAFGGDAGNVTVFGQSAGGAMVLNLLAAPGAKGLYQKVIIESGVGYRAETTLTQGEAAGAKMATTLGLPGADATLDQLRSLPVEAMVGNPAVRQGVGGVIDGRLMTRTPLAAMQAGQLNHVPLLVGSNDGEGGADNVRRLVEATASGAPVWRYYFTYVPAWKKAAQKDGAIHSAELVYVFDSWDTSSAAGPGLNAGDRAVAKRVNSCWVAFARMAPGTRTLDCADGLKWPAYTPANDAAVEWSEHPILRKASTIPPGPTTGPGTGAPPAPVG